MNIFLKIISLIILVVFYNTAFSSINGENQTIKQINNNIKQIEKEREIQNIKIKTLKKDLFINKFFKTDLLTKERYNLDLLVDSYSETKKKLEFGLKNNQSKNTIKLLLENEKEIYKNLLPYIKKEKYTEYKEFIKQDLELINKKILLENNQTQKQKELDKKLVIIKQKIILHKQLINRKIKKIVNKKIEDKLQILINKESFKNLILDDKIRFFETLSKKIELKLEKLKKQNIKDNKKIQIYNIIIEKVTEFKKKFL